MKPKAPRGAGRPRDPEVDTAILEAAQHLLATRGFAGTSVESVARDAGVTKPTVYKRWPTKADLATAALAHLQAAEDPPSGGTARARLLTILSSFQRNLLRPNGMAMVGTVLVEEERNPELLALFRRRILGPRRAMLRTVLEEARAEGELRADVDCDAAVNMIIGSYYARYLAGEAIPRDWPERVITTLWQGAGKTDSTPPRTPPARTDETGTHAHAHSS